MSVVMSPEEAALAPPTEGDGQRWLLRKNCSFTPRQVLIFYGSLTALSFAFASVFAWRGAWMVWPFALVENAALAVALLFYGRHALDRECVFLEGDTVHVAVVRGHRTTHHRFNADWVRLDWRGRRADVLWLCEGRREVVVGTFLTPGRRRRFAQELRSALRAR